jgi:hypothetical protein
LSNSLCTDLIINISEPSWVKVPKLLPLRRGLVVLAQ